MDDMVVLSSSSTRHSCKVCGKGFPCGRSLGGHMRSHALAEVAAAAAVGEDDETDSDEEDEEQRRWTMPISGARASNTNASGAGYGLRENPKKTRRLSRSAGADGAMEEEDQDDMLIPLPTEAAVMAAPRRRRRSMRVPAPAPAFDKEPEDVALCLIMLSRDTAGLCNLPSSESSEKGDGRKKLLAYDGSDDDVLYTEMTNNNNNNKAAISSSENNPKRGRYECPGCGRAFQSYQALGGHRASHKRINSNCCTTKVFLDQPEPSVDTNVSSFSTPSSPPPSPQAMAPVVVKPKNNVKFECPICSKVFGSGQALGGHKRSHSIAGELYDRTHADAIILDADQSLLAAGFLDLNLPAPGVQD
ncbi:zinc finger protein ZAT5 [Brachypodium distachyon]|uniref:C2H2-type domain-containing protein n=1 Tax=Brachypodium distachyon TaxID=15368 RepID=I1GQS7_BRADI|nr:zinc finger protein ZAT5 [Brachypodium distachyon]KQK14433.1 hypothetical protein BRADI_1g16200v3 [Brachypodium distachyon]|eukprot:XP_003559736.2 zinc finger protein ZAT5 [Brachypodium distachyon]